MPRKFHNLNEYLAANGIKKADFAVELGVSRFQLTGLCYPQKYPVRLTEDLADRIASLLNQSPDYVRKLYPRAA